MSKQTKKKTTPKKPVESPVEKVTEIPACCPRCQSTERTGKHCVKTTPLTGVTVTGQPYTHVVNFRASCAKCGQRLAYNSFENRV